jgi:hypothetical protein
MTVSESTADVSKLSLTPSFEIYLHLGFEDIVVDDFDVSGGVKFEPALPLTLEFSPNPSLYGQLKETLTLCWLNLNIPKFFFDAGVGVTLESKFPYESPKWLIWPATLGYWTDVADTSWFIDDAPRSYQIDSEAKLAGLAKLVNSGHSFSGSTFIFTRSLNLAGREWTPIGNFYNHFRGTFDGGGNTNAIANLMTNVQNSTYNSGLFGPNRGALKNIHLTNARVSSNLSFTDSTNYVGILAASNEYDGTIDGCTVSGNVYSYYSLLSSSYAGGLVGVNNGTITDCTVNVDVSSLPRPNISSDGIGRNCFTMIGGIAGINGGTIMSCTASGNISSSFTLTPTVSYAGGIVGFDDNGTIDGCTSRGLVSSYSGYSSYGYSDFYTSYSSAGGIVGSGGGTITGSTSRVTSVTATNTAGGAAYRGGFIGNFYGSTLRGGNRNESGISPAIGYDERVSGPSDNINS